MFKGNKELWKSGLKVYVTSLERGRRVVAKKLLSDSLPVEPYTSKDKKYLIERSFKLFLLNRQIDIEFKVLPGAEDTFTALKPDIIAEAYSKETKKKIGKYIFFFMEEGEVVDLKKVETANELCISSNEYKEVVALYRDSDQLKNDVIGSKLSCVKFGDLESLGKADLNRFFMSSTKLDKYEVKVSY